MGTNLFNKNIISAYISITYYPKHGKNVRNIRFIRKDRSRITSLVSPTPVFGIDGDYQGSFAVITDISQQKQTEKILIAEQKQLKEQVESAVVHIDNLLKESEEYRLALKVLLKNNDDEKKTIEESFVTNVRNTITPFLDRLKNTRLNDNQKQLIEVIEKSMDNIVSPFVRRVKAEMWDFTPMEIHVANLVMEGSRNKDIADILNISESTVGFHRSSIRKKFRLTNQKINLRTYLLSLQD